MENKKSFLFANSVFDSKNYLERLKKSYLEMSNNPVKKKDIENINFFTKTIKTKYPLNSKSQKIDSMPKQIKKNADEFNMKSCPNEKYFKNLDLNKKYINIMHSKLINSKAIKSIINKNIKNNIKTQKDENNKFNVYYKENKFVNFINHLKDNQTFYKPFSINKNNSTKYSNKYKDCLQVIPVNPEKTEGNEPTKKAIKDKMRLTSNNSWFRKTMVQNLKVPFLPRMKRLNEKRKKENEQVKTFFHLTSNPIQQNLSLYNFKKKIISKNKNLISFEIYTLPGTEKFQQKINQDSYLVIPNVNNTHNAKIFGVFDGHGINGDKLSQEIRDYFIEYLSDKKKYEKEIVIDSNERLSKDENLEKVYKKFISLCLKKILKE